MVPSIAFRIQPIVAGVVGSLVLGLLWYGFLFGRLWPRAAGLEKPPGTVTLVRSSVVNAVAVFVLGVGLSFGVAVWRPSTWGAGQDAPPHRYAFFAALYGWVSYVLPTLLGGVAWERTRWSALLIGAIYRLLCMVMLGLLIVYWT